MPDPPHFTETQQFEGKLRLLMSGLAATLVAVGIYVTISAITDSSLTTVERATLGLIAVPVGLLLPLAVVTQRLRITVCDEYLRVSFFVFRSKVRLEHIQTCEVVVIDAMREYGGWGLKGKRGNLFYSVGGIEAVRVSYQTADSSGFLTMTSKHCHEICNILKSASEQ